MNRVSSLLLVCLWLVGGAIPCAAQETKPPPTAQERLRFLEAENNMLRGQIKSLRDQLAGIKTKLESESQAREAQLKREVEGLRATNARLRTRALWSVPTPITKPSADRASSKPAAPVYRGRRVTPEWLEEQYQKFADTIVLVDGRFYETGKPSLLTKRGIWKKPPPIGSLRWGKAESDFRKATVVQVLPGGTGLVKISMWGVGVPAQSMMIHVRGLGPKWVDGLALPDVPLVYLGPYSYTSASGGRRTVQDYRVHRPLTRPEFARALAEEFELSE